MDISSKLTTGITAAAKGIKKFSGKPLGVMSKAMGVAAIGGVLYDSHVNGRDYACIEDEKGTADKYYNQFMNYSKSDTQSATVAGLKKGYLNIQRNFTYYHPIFRTKGYIKEFGKTLIGNLPILGTATVALACKHVGKAAGVLLSIHSIRTLVYEVAGVGKKKEKISN